MTVRRTTIATVALAVVGAAMLVPRAPHAGAATNLETAWWWIGQAQTGLAPAPPMAVPDGGLWVSANASGPHAMSAVRFSLGADEAAPILTLKINREEPPASATVVACPMTGPWTPVTAGAWTSRPTYDCKTSVLPSRGITDNNTLAFDLSTIVVGKVVDVALVPLQGPVQPPPQVPAIPSNPTTGVAPDTSTPFDITFDKPADSSVATFLLPSDDAGSGTGADIPPPAFAVTDPAPFAFPSTPTFPTFPSLASSPTTSPTTGVAVRRIVTPAVAVPPVDSRSASRVLAAVVFFALAAWWYQLTFAGAGDTKRSRPRLSLYDDPRRVMASAANARSAHAGRAPSLR